MQTALLLLITGLFGTIGPAFFHIHSSKHLDLCVEDRVSEPIFYQLVNNGVFQGPVNNEKQPNHIHFVPFEEDCLVCNLSSKINFEIPDVSWLGSSIVGEDTFLSINSLSLFTVSPVTAYNKGSPRS